jgi:hypothetical protein
MTGDQEPDIRLTLKADGTLGMSYHDSLLIREWCRRNSIPFDRIARMLCDSVNDRLRKEEAQRCRQE